MANITFINVMNDEYSVHAHKTGCRDIARTLRKDPFNEDAGTGEYSTRREAFEDYNEDFLAEDSGAWDIKFHACCGLPA